jgi:hypothetical protein
MLFAQLQVEGDDHAGQDRHDDDLETQDEPEGETQRPEHGRDLLVRAPAADP